jgi:hypothetical protein
VQAPTGDSRECVQLARLGLPVEAHLQVSKRADLALDVKAVIAIDIWCDSGWQGQQPVSTSWIAQGPVKDRGRAHSGCQLLVSVAQQMYDLKPSR